MQVIQNRRWIRRLDPFPHVVADEVFDAATYESLVLSFRDVLGQGLREQQTEDRVFSRSMGNYDAYACHLRLLQDTPFRLFLSREWHDLVARLFDINATGDVDGGLHHHRVGGKSGTIHNDLSPGWFGGTPSSDRVIVSDPGQCNYHHGRPSAEGIVPRATARVVALLYYLNNPPYTAGDGGETGLYRSPYEPLTAAAAVIPPVNNSLLAFECTPYSLHSFLSNRRHPRNSIIMWVHRPLEEAVARWTDSQIVKWK